MLDTHIQEAADLLCDMYFHSRFGRQETDLERGVILEEIGMYEDTPDDLVIERLSSAIYKGSSLGRPFWAPGRPWRRSREIPCGIIAAAVILPPIPWCR